MDAGVGDHTGTNIFGNPADVDSEIDDLLKLEALELENRRRPNDEPRRNLKEERRGMRRHQDDSEANDDEEEMLL